jgi:predicted ATPase
MRFESVWIAALLSPRPAPLLVLNEPETSLHPDLLPALGRLIGAAARHSQVVVVSHASRLVAALEACADCHSIRLHKQLGMTEIEDEVAIARPAWRWPARS